MTNKPKKHSEIKKNNKQKKSTASKLASSWGNSIGQTYEIRPDRYLIVTEGEKTEPEYFQSIQARIEEKYGRGRVKEITVEPGCTNTVDLFNKAKELANKDINGIFDHVWVVYDKDDFPDENFNKVPEYCKNESNEETSYDAAWSNEAFELWYLLHFDYMDTGISRKQYFKKLSNRLNDGGYGPYKKNREDMFDILEDKLDFAIKNAKRLEKANKEATPSDSKPGTTVYRLIEELRPYFQ